MENTFKHTAGEWKVAMSGGQVWANNEKTICTLKSVPLLISDEVLANAKLIAAAPELLDKLIMAYSFMVTNKDYQGRQILETIKEAIQKATL